MTARLMLSVGILTALASVMAFLSRGLPSGSPPPIRAAIVISLMSFVKARPRFASIAPFLCLILCHLEWPDIDLSLNRQTRFKFKPPGCSAPLPWYRALRLLFRVSSDAGIECFRLFRFVDG